jgi:mgtE-like transporter
MLALMLVAGVLATTLSCFVAYIVGFVTYRMGWDPDNNGIPLVTSASDFLGAASLMVSLAILGLS